MFWTERSRRCDGDRDDACQNEAADVGTGNASETTLANRVFPVFNHTRPDSARFRNLSRGANRRGPRMDVLRWPTNRITTDGSVHNAARRGVFPWVGAVRRRAVGVVTPPALRWPRFQRPPVRLNRKRTRPIPFRSVATIASRMVQKRSRSIPLGQSTLRIRCRPIQLTPQLTWNPNLPIGQSLSECGMTCRSSIKTKLAEGIRPLWLLPS
jgi:hypothetical protein